MDLGACPKSHTERLKTEFLAAREAEPNNPIFHKFQMEYESNIFAFVDECDRRIRAAHRRLEKTPEENAKTTNLVSGTVFVPLGLPFDLDRYVNRCEKLRKLSWLSREGQRRLNNLVSCGARMSIDSLLTCHYQVSKGKLRNQCVRWPLLRL